MQGVESLTVLAGEVADLKFIQFPFRILLSPAVILIFGGPYRHREPLYQRTRNTVDSLHYQSELARLSR